MVASTSAYNELAIISQYYHDNQDTLGRYALDHHIDPKALADYTNQYIRDHNNHFDSAAITQHLDDLDKAAVDFRDIVTGKLNGSDFTLLPQEKQETLVNGFTIDSILRQGITISTKILELAKE